MSSQEAWVRITLRLPAELHRSLTDKAAGASLNAQIVKLLEAATGSDESAAGFHFLDAIGSDAAAKARVTARFHLAAATKLSARDVVFLDPEMCDRIVAVTGDEYRAHDAARSAIDAAFPVQGVTWGEIAEALAGLGPKAPSHALDVREAIDQRLAAAPTIAGRVAI